MLVAATSDGAIVADVPEETFRGVDRSGRRVWTDAGAMGAGADAVCAERCPDAVFSGSFQPSGPDPEPWLSARTAACAGGSRMACAEGRRTPLRPFS